MKKKTLLFIGGGLETVHAVRQAQSRGLHVIVSDFRADAPAMVAADDQLLASTYDIEATCAEARRYHDTVQPINGVLSVGVDVPRTVAAVAADLGLVGISREAAALSADKLAMKQRFQRDGVPIPWFAEVATPHELSRIACCCDEMLVVKPVDSRGSRGVQRLLPGLDPSLAFSRARDQSPSGRVMVEAYLEGPQVSTESLILKGRAYTPGFSDRNYELLDRFAPYFIENGGELPSALPRRTQDAVRALVEQAAASIGVTDGMLKGDIVVHEGKPYVIEVATRLSGGYFCTLEIPLNTGVDFLGAVIAWALGEPVDTTLLTPLHQRPVVQRYAFLDPGEVVNVSGIEEARKLPGVAEVMVYVKPGDLIRVPTDTTARAAMAIASGETLVQAEARALAALKAIKIETAEPGQAYFRKAVSS